MDGGKPLVVELSVLFAARIGGTSIGLYGDLSVTELDSHANMAVAGSVVAIQSLLEVASMRMSLRFLLTFLYWKE